MIWEFGGKPIPDDLVEDVARVAREVPPGLRALLDADEIDAVKKRAKAVVARPVLPGRHLWSSVPVADGVIERLVEEGDLDELVRLVDRLCDEREWGGLIELRDRCRWALERGKQLWPAASLAEYRVALEAPGRWAASVVTEGAGRFALGPLPEVAASTHLWEELSPHLASGPFRAITAHECVVRGKDLTGGLVDRSRGARGAARRVRVGARLPDRPVSRRQGRVPDAHTRSSSRR